MDGSLIPCHRVVMRPPARFPPPRSGWREGLARVVRPAELAVLMLGMVGAAWACLPELGSSCHSETPTGLAAPPVFADEQIDDELRRSFALYLVGGRSDTEIHLSAAGLDVSARTRPLGDGSHHCLISGLRPREPGLDRETARLLLASRLIHEATHCQTSPSAADLRRDAAGSPADLLVALALESIADARAVLEVFRVDGQSRARSAVELALNHRRGNTSVAHATSLALRDALALATQRPDTLRTAQQTFAAALEIGQAAALQTLPGLMHTLGHAPAAAASAPVLERAAELGAAMGQALRAFEHGRFDNRAATLHTFDHVLSRRDHHFFVAADGSISLRGVSGPEGAQRHLAQAEGAERDAAPPQRLAVRWLRCQAALDAPALKSVSTSLANLIRNFSDGSVAQTDRVVALLDTSIERCRRGQALREWLDNAVDLLKAARAAG